MSGGDNTLEESSTCSEGGDSRVPGRRGVLHSAVSNGLSGMGVLELRPT